MFFKKYFIPFLLLFLSVSASAQHGYEFDITTDSQTDQTMFVGRCTFDDLNEEASYDWLTIGSTNYNPEPSVIEELKKKLPSCEVFLFIGTWCDDTRNLLPKMYKTMLLSRCYTNYKMYAVDRNKKSKQNEQEPFRVTNVPTIIVMKNGIELGRIVETTTQNIESALLKIVSPVEQDTKK